VGTLVAEVAALGLALGQLYLVTVVAVLVSKIGRTTRWAS